MERITFEDLRIAEVLDGSSLTTEEQMFLIEDTLKAAQRELRGA